MPIIDPINGISAVSIPNHPLDNILNGEIVGEEVANRPHNELLDNDVYLAGIVEDLEENLHNNYYTKVNLQTSGESIVNWNNISNKPNHNDLNGLQGGAFNDYVHLTTQEYLDLIGLIQRVENLENAPPNTLSDTIGILDINPDTFPINTPVFIATLPQFIRNFRVIAIGAGGTGAGEWVGGDFHSASGGSGGSMDIKTDVGFNDQWSVHVLRTGTHALSVRMTNINDPLVTLTVGSIGFGTSASGYTSPGIGGFGSNGGYTGLNGTSVIYSHGQDATPPGGPESGPRQFFQSPNPNRGWGGGTSLLAESQYGRVIVMI